jgi:cytoskeleton protein RodZ
MPKRDPESELVEEEVVELEPSPVGERLRAAREAKKLTLEDLAAQTRIPQRHLAAIETGDWEHLPAPTYTIGFAKSYASAVDLDRNEIGNDLREEMGGQRFASTSSDVFEPADPARTMPKGLVIGAIAAVILLVVLMSWLNNRSLQGTDEPAAPDTNVAAPQAAAPAQAPAAAAQGPVVLTATEPVWLAIKDGTAVLKQGIMQAGETFQVPATAAAPMLTTAKAEALKINVGNAVAGPIGPAATKITSSLLPADLLKTPAPQTSATPPAPSPAATAPRPAPQRTRPPRAAVAPPITVPEAAPNPPAPAATTNNAQ